MLLSRFFYLALFIFSAQAFSKPNQCVNLTGIYHCSLSGTNAPFDLSFEQSLNADNVPVVTLKLMTPDKTLMEKNFIADNKIHDDHFTVCEKDSFSVVLSENNGHFLTNTHYLTPAGDIEIVKHVVTIEMDGEEKAKEMKVQQNLGKMHCKKIQ